MSEWLGGIDIGGTKCAVSLALREGSNLSIVEKRISPTPDSPQQALEMFATMLDELLLKHRPTRGNIPLSAIGISCGGPLDAERGLILSPPNLPGWDHIDVITPFKTRYHVPVAVENDANACALAEWTWGAGIGTKHMIFLTFGTGMGAGFILNGRLYSGANGMAGEVGHIRMEDNGPIGYGKVGSFEGFCSGGGIARLAATKALEAIQLGRPPSFCPHVTDIAQITAQKVAEAANREDPLALEIFRKVGQVLGRGLSVLVDVLNPELIVIGSIYLRQQSLLEPIVLAELDKEALGISMNVCRIVPAGLGEQIGDYASFAIAMEALERGNN
jgi:glucokinase